MGLFGFFDLIKNNAETASLIDKNCLSQEAFYTALQIFLNCYWFFEIFHLAEQVELNLNHMQNLDHFVSNWLN